MSKKLINKNLATLVSAFNDDTISGAALEGATRSGKTWAGVDFLVWVCSKHLTNATCNIIKETYNSFKTTLYDDFNRRLPAYGISSPFVDRQEVRTFNLLGNKVNLLGADSETVLEGVGSDLVWENELLNISQNAHNQSEQRCRLFWWGDYNPKFTTHWVYNRICNRPDVKFLHTSYLDNPFISKQEKRKVLSYEPTHPEDRLLPRDQRRPHPLNIRAGTADEYMWDVYGLGLRSAPEGLIFRDVKYVKKWPDEIDRFYYGQDFGFSIDPSALVKIGVLKKPELINGVLQKGKLYMELLHYGPTASSGELAAIYEQVFKGEDRRFTVWSDSDQGGMVSDMRNKYKYKVMPARKFKGSILYGISLLNQYELYAVSNDFVNDIRNEAGAYKWREISGIQIEEPIDDFNHFWDAVRYAALSNLRLLK